MAHILAKLLPQHTFCWRKPQVSPRSAALQISLKTCRDAGGYTMSSTVLENAAVFVGAVCGQDFNEIGQEHKQQGIDEKQTTQGLVGIQLFTAFSSS